MGTPDLFSAFVNDGVLVRVDVVGEGAGRGGPEMGKKLVFGVEGDDGEGEFLGDRSGRGRRRDDGDGGFNNGGWEVLYWDVRERDTVDDFLKLEMDVSVLGFVGRGVLELRAEDISLLGGDVGKDMEEVGRGVDAVDSDEGRGGGNAVTFASGAGAITGAWIIPGVVGAVEKVLDNLVGGGDVELINVIKLGPRGSGEGGGGDDGGEGGRRRHWGQLASLRDCSSVETHYFMTSSG